jgi:hypothetical protein
MYYNRTISKDLSSLLEENGQLRWLFDFVKKREDLDFLIGKNNSKEWISVYRGLTRIISITLKNNNTIFIDGAETYKNILPALYRSKSVDDKFQDDIENLILQIEQNSQFDRYYKKKKEGYYQNELSRIYGICGKADDDFVIIDKEVVIGYSNQTVKDTLFGEIQQKYKNLQREISAVNPEKFGKDLYKKSIGNELDFLALDKDGNILMMELKHGTNTSGIYLSPLQIGLYADIHNKFKENLGDAVFEMLEQKQKIGLINPNWKKPNCIKDLIPVLIISDYNYEAREPNSRYDTKSKFDEILQLIRKKLESNFLSNLRALNYTTENGLSNW